MPVERAPTKPLRADAQRNRARILDAAEAVFSQKGTSASTEEVAARAGVAIGTVFRHFPTKADLLSAIMKNLRGQLTALAEELVADTDASTALFTFFTVLVERAAATQTVVELLARDGIEIAPAKPIQEFEQALQEMLSRAQEAGAVRPDIRVADVIALLTSLCHGAMQGKWDEELRQRTLGIVFAGMRTSGGSGTK